MKFTCERCGKKYATAEDPAPGRVYKLKCKACGHLIVVKAASPGAFTRAGSSATEALPSSPSSAFAPPDADLPQPQSTPEADLGVTPPPLGNPFATPGRGNGAAEPGSRGGEPTAEISVSGISGEDPVVPASRTSEGYIDLFGDASGEAPHEEEKIEEDPFLAAARASLPDTYGAGAVGSVPDPLAMGLETTPPPRAPTRRLAPADLISPAASEAGEGKKKQLGPVALMGVGVAAIVGILVFVLVKGGPKAPESHAAAPALPITAPEPTQQQPPKAEPPKPEEAKAEPPEPEQVKAEAPRPEPAKADEPKPPKPAVAKGPPPLKPEPREKSRKQEKRAERAPERKPEPKVAVAAAPPKPEPKQQVDLPEAAGALTEEAVNKVISANRRAFEGCISAAKGSDVKLDGRKVALRLTVNPNGFVTYPTLDDVTLNSTDLGTCLKSAARLMVFPKFHGDPVHAEVPLLLKP